ncbi:MAG: D-aminoacylase [bacterium]|nr:D-aminoacylase [bacterium]
MYDILIKNGLIVDGSGETPFYADLAIADGKIARIAPQIDDEARRVINAEGLQVAPGFIDSHTHSDTIIFTGSNSYNYLEQGVTTQIAGQCGSSPAPYSEGNLEEAKLHLPPEEYERWVALAQSPASFMAAAEQASIGTNMAFFIGHGALRAKAMGYVNRAPNEAEMACMKADLVQAMEAGYLGFTSGLVYVPSAYAQQAELVELARAMAPYKGVYASHIRGEGDHVLRSVKEAIAVGAESGVSVLISHLKVMGRHNEGQSAALLAEIERANKRGVSVCADQYPYNASSAPLSSQIPPKYLEGGTAAMLERLKDSAIRKQILYSIFNEVDEFESGIYSAGFDGCMIVEARMTPQYVNKTIGQIARTEGKEPIDVMCDVLLENQGVIQGIYFNQSASDLLRIMGHPLVYCGSDWSDYPDERVDFEQVGGGHPRGTGTMIRRLELVRDFRLRSMEESIRNITYDTAQAIGLSEQGILKEGRDANITVFRYDELHATADFTHPYRPNKGIHWVLVNGDVAVEHGLANGHRSGKVLKRG